jgi:hypothetical protein
MKRFSPALVLAFLVGASALQAQEIIKPLGKWERKSGKNQVTLIVEDNRLHMISTGENVGALHADYSMTRDGVIYGVITSVECDDEDGDSTNSLFNRPFSFRYRIDEGALIIYDAKGRDSGKDEFYNGRFKAAQTVSNRTAIVPTMGTYPATGQCYPPMSGSNYTKEPISPSPIGSSFVAPLEDKTTTNNSARYVR